MSGNLSGNLGNRVAKNPPYEDTDVDYTRTKAEIECLLKSYGVQGVRWTSQIGQDDVLEFLAEADVLGVKKIISVAVSPPRIILQRKKGPKEDINQEYRLLFYWIKSKIEAVTWGLSTIESEFLSQIRIALPNGQTTTVGATVANLVAKDNLASLPYFGAEHPNPPIEFTPRTQGGQDTANPHTNTPTHQHTNTPAPRQPPKILNPDYKPVGQV